MNYNCSFNDAEMPTTATFIEQCLGEAASLSGDINTGQLKTNRFNAPHPGSISLWRPNSSLIMRIDRAAPALEKL